MTLAIQLSEHYTIKITYQSEYALKPLATKINAYENVEQAIDAVLALPAKVSVVSFLNAHAYTMANSNEEFNRCLLQSDILLRDGIGAKWLLKAYGLEHGYNANGTDLIPLFLAASNKYTVCFIGTESPHIEKAAINCNENGVNIIGHMDGFKTTEEMFTFVSYHKPKCLVLGMGMPRQEIFANYLQNHYHGDLLVINGGAIFDFIAGRFQRAPKLYRKLGLEWFYRLINEPKRLFKRYVFGIPVFAISLLKHKLNNS